MWRGKRPQLFYLSEEFEELLEDIEDLAIVAERHEEPCWHMTNW